MRRVGGGTKSDRRLITAHADPGDAQLDLHLWTNGQACSRCDLVPGYGGIERAARVLSQGYGGEAARFAATAYAI